MTKQRPKSRSERVTTLLHLVRLGASTSFLDISTKRLGDSLDLSQQASSVRLVELQRAGLIERAHSGRGLAVRLTESGLKIVEGFLAEASTSLERGKNELKFKGMLFTGLNEGGYYVSLKGYSKSFLGALRFEPFPGTLNLRLTDEAMVDQRRRLGLLEGIDIPGFSDEKRTYGPVKVFRARIAERYPGAVLAIERTHYDNTVLEVISPHNLRKVLKLKDGDECSVTAFTE